VKEFLRFHNVRYVEHVEVADDLAAAQITALLDEDNDTATERADALLTSSGLVTSDDLVGECDDEDINIEET
jgi:ribosome-binding factor A